MCRFLDEKERWGRFVYPKINLPDVLMKQVKKASGKSVVFSTATDAYQPLEAKFGVTRACLELLAKVDCRVEILTKSALVVRDVDLITKFDESTVGFSMSYHDERLRAAFEDDSAPIRARVDALRMFKQKGVATWIFMSPILPLVTNIDRIIEIAATIGCGLSMDFLNPYPRVLKSLAISYRKLGLNFDDAMRLLSNADFRKAQKLRAIEKANRIGVQLTCY